MICWVCLSSLFRKILPSIGQGTRFRLVTYEGSIKQGFEKWGRASNPKPKAQFGFGHLGVALWLHTRPEIKAQFGSGHLGAIHQPPLIRVRLPGRIKEPTRYFCYESLTVRNSYGHNIPLMLFSKDTLFQCAWFSCHYYLTVREPGLRACQLSLAFVGASFCFVSHAYLLLIKRPAALFCSYKQFSSGCFFTFSRPTS